MRDALLYVIYVYVRGIERNFLHTHINTRSYIHTCTHAHMRTYTDVISSMVELYVFLLFTYLGAYTHTHIDHIYSIWYL